MITGLDRVPVEKAARMLHLNLNDLFDEAFEIGICVWHDWETGSEYIEAPDFEELRESLESDHHH